MRHISRLSLLITGWLSVTACQLDSGQGVNGGSDQEDGQPIRGQAQPIRGEKQPIRGENQPIRGEFQTIRGMDLQICGDERASKSEKRF